MKTIFAAVLCISMVAGEQCSVLTPGESQVIEETNAARVAAGEQPLVVDCRLMNSARRHARRLARDMVVVHSSDKVAENVNSGAENAKEVVVLWLRSPGHRSNIVSRSHRRIGVAGFIGQDGKAYWVQQFSP